MNFSTFSWNIDIFPLLTDGCVDGILYCAAEHSRVAGEGVVSIEKCEPGSTESY